VVSQNPDNMALRTGALAASLFLLGNGARVKRHSGQPHIAGIPIHNSEALTEDSDFTIVFKQHVDKDSLHAMCKGLCTLMGNPDKGGAPFAKVSKKAVEQVVQERPEDIEVLAPDALDYAIPDFPGQEILGILSVGASTASWGLERVGVPDRAFTGKGVHIYVQDTGIRSTHRDFGGRVIPTIDLSSDSLVECNGNKNCATDAQGHGTHCAGTAGGKTYGVASDATLHAVKTLSDEGSGARSWQYSAMDWVTTSGLRPAVLSMSLGGKGADSGYTPVVDAATRSGVTVVVAAGNSNSDSCGFSPAFAAKAITVGATDSSNQRASYSNYGSCNNIMAPGSDIVSASSSSDTGSRSLSGTSMACPHVSGGAALLLEQNPSKTSASILATMLSTGRIDLISGLKPNDPKEFLWVGKSEAPVSPPTQAPPAPVTRRRRWR
jgi:subtilisin family serine protease